MIHELIDQKKRTFRCSTARSTKTVSENNNKNLTEIPNLEQSNDIKEVDSSSTAFIPPWLRNSLGLNQRTNQSHANSDQKSARTIPRYKEPSNNGFENLKVNSDQDCSFELPDQLDNCLEKNCEVEITLTQEPDVTQASCINSSKAGSVVLENASKDSKVDLNTIPHSKLLKQEDLIMKGADVVTSYEIDKIRDEEKKRLRLIRQRNRLKRRAVNDQKPPELGKDEVSLLLEMKAREVLHNYKEKNVHTSASDIKQLEAKLILLSAKCEIADESKLGPQELRLLKEINEQARSKEDFEKLIEHVKETNLKEILRGANEMAKALGDKPKKLEENVKHAKKEDRGMKDIVQTPRRNENENNSNLEKDTIVSTDDENDIKRFSDLLSKNKNMDEKRRCLEEVRNYFEKKRRTRMTKRRTMDESKIPKSIHFGDKKDDFVKDKDKLKFKDVPMVLNCNEKKLKLPCDEEVVKKAVNETLQKFVDLYHFHVSPSVLGTVRKNILQAIQTDSVEAGQLKRSSKNEQQDGGKTEKPGTEEGGGLKDKKEEKNEDNIVDKVLPKSPTNKEENKRNFTGVPEDSSCQTQKSDQKNNVVENKHIERLIMEFEAFLYSMQAHTDITDLKLQSVILEKEEESSNSQSLQFVYNFTKKLLESKKPNQESGPSVLNEEKTSEMYKDAEAQTPDKPDTGKRNIKIQTCVFKVFCDRNLQTENVSCKTSVVQTDDLGLTLKELKDLKGEDVSTGLYRMIKSREKGKFYLYPEDLDESKTQFACNKSSMPVLPSHDCGTNTDTTNFPMNSYREEKISKEKTFLFKERDSKFRKNRENNVYASCISKKTPDKGDISGSDLENSISCLFFRDSGDKTSEFVTKTSSSMDEEILCKGDTTKDTNEPGQENHLGCVWFWNGEKISPGFDLKVHVEDLLSEKLKEMSGMDGAGCKLLDSGKRHEKDGYCSPASYPAEDVACGTVSVELKNAFDYEQGSNSAIDIRPLVFSEESEPEKKIEEEYSAQNVETIILDCAKNEDKRVRDIGTQSSQQTILSLNITKLKSGSRTNSSRKSCKRNSRNKSFIVKPMRRVRSSVIYIKKPWDVAKTVRKLKKMKLKIENVKLSDTTSSTPSVVEGSTSSSTSNNYSEDPVGVILGLRKNSEGEGTPVLDVKRKIRKIIGSVDHQSQKSKNCDVQQDYDVRKTSMPPESENPKHWELIENVLSKISQKERESLWGDISQFIKNKIGRDINDEGAREVCIEIEQDIPKAAGGKAKHGVLATGHYGKNEGDVEVEIDLTLDDLERILRHRRKKNRRRHWGNTSKSRKLPSSSSTHSDFRKMISLIPLTAPPVTSHYSIPGVETLVCSLDVKPLALKPDQLLNVSHRFRWQLAWGKNTEQYTSKPEQYRDQLNKLNDSLKEKRSKLVNKEDIVFQRNHIQVWLPRNLVPVYRKLFLAKRLIQMRRQKNIWISFLSRKTEIL